jgi:hypothetical protein
MKLPRQEENAPAGAPLSLNEKTVGRLLRRPAVLAKALWRRASGTLPVAELARVQASCKPELWRVQLRVSYFLPLAYNLAA